MIRTELLAPAKNKEIAISAINCGADAIYIGANFFGARQNASNSLEDIKEVIDYAHKFWARVFITINTILDDKEVFEAIELIKKLDKLGADAVIIQDMGLLELLKQEKLSIPIHISTQCDNRNVEKVSFFNKIGVSRVVLARELSLDKIKEIHQTNPNLELEAFMHGALCVSYSGQCYLSQFIGGRSANRGECAQPCRKKYSVITENGNILLENAHALCLKDFNGSKYLKQMAENGVYSFKIEGRLKDENYVKNVVSFYRQELDKFSQKSSSGKSFINFIPNPEKSFNRGFTTYFLKEREECFNFSSPKSKGEFIGIIVEINKNKCKIKTNKSLNVQDGLTNGVDGILINKIENGYIFANKSIPFKKGEKIYRNVDVEFEKQLSEIVKRRILVNITIENNIIKLIDEDKNEFFMTITETELAKNQEKMNETFKKQFSKMGETDFYLGKLELNSDIPFMPVSQINQLRRKCLENLMQVRLKNYPKQIQKSLNDAEYYLKEVDYRANIHNKIAKSFYENSGVNIIECSLEKHLPDRQIELMRTKHCIKYALNICKSPEKLYLIDEKGVKFPLKFDCKNCEMCVLSPQN